MPSKIARGNDDQGKAAPHGGSLVEHVLFHADLGPRIGAYLGRLKPNMTLCAKGGRCLYTPTIVQTNPHSKLNVDHLGSLLLRTEGRLRCLTISNAQARILWMPEMLPVLHGLRTLVIKGSGSGKHVVPNMMRAVAAGVFQNLKKLGFHIHGSHGQYGN